MSSTASEIHRSVLKELGNIGAGHAATALANIMGLTVGLTETTVESLPIDPSNLKTRNGERDVAALQMSIYGKAPAEMVIVFDHAEADTFVKRFLMSQIGEVELTAEIVDSSLREIANIIGGSYLTAIIEMIGIDLLPSTPTLHKGRFDSILADLLEDCALPAGTEAFLINNGFINERGAINVEFLLIPRQGSLESYMRAFGING